LGWLTKRSNFPEARDVMSRVIILKYQYVRGLAAVPHEHLAQIRRSSTEEEWSQFLREELARSNQLEQSLRQSGLWKSMTLDEQKLIRLPSSEITDRQRVNASWTIEGIVCLLWALDYVAEFPPYDQISDPELANQIPRQATSTLLQNASLRPREQIQKQQALAELWHWRSRTRQLQERGLKFSANQELNEIIENAAAAAFGNGDLPHLIENDFPAFGKAYRHLSDVEYQRVASIAVERHRALNWLCGRARRNRWDKTPTDT